MANFTDAYRGLKIITSLSLRFPDFQRKQARIGAREQRLAKIVQIESKDNQTKKELGDQITMLRVKAKTHRLNEIIQLKDALKIAKELGVVENSFSGKTSNKVLSVQVGKGVDMPTWYLFGSKALASEIEVLEAVSNDDPYIPGLVDLQNQLKALEHNRLLETLRARDNDDAFVEEISRLTAEKKTLEALVFSPQGITSRTVNNYSYPPEYPIKPNKRLVVVLGGVLGLMLGIFAAFLVNFLEKNRKQEDEVTAL